jgi:hypothetical protein
MLQLSHVFTMLPNVSGYDDIVIWRQPGGFGVLDQFQPRHRQHFR